MQMMTITQVNTYTYTLICITTHTHLSQHTSWVY